MMCYSFWYDLLIMLLYLIVIVGGYFAYIYICDQRELLESQAEELRILKRKLIATDLLINGAIDSMDSVFKDVEKLKSHRTSLRRTSPKPYVKKKTKKNPIEAAATIDLPAIDAKKEEKK